MGIRYYPLQATYPEEPVRIFGKDMLGAYPPFPLQKDEPDYFVPDPLRDLDLR